MNVKRIVKKMSALVAGATMVGATVMGAMAYDLGDYPSPFVKDGMGDFVIVVGENAKTADVIGATDIAASLQASAVVEEAIEVPGLAGEVSLKGISYKLETPSDKLEIGEAVGDVVDTLTETELSTLKSGRITTSQGSTDYKQYLRVGKTNGAGIQADFGVNFIENDDDVLADYLVFKDDKTFFEWELDFTEGLESELSGTGATQDADDIEDKVLNIFGTDYSIVKAESTGTNTGLELTLMGGSVASQLNEGETKTFTIDGVDYVVSLVFVSDPQTGSTGAEARFQVNGEMTDAMTEGETTTLSNGVQMGVRDILVNPRAGAASFFLGADKLVLTDTNVSNTLDPSSSEGNVEANNEDLSEGKLAISATFTGTTDVKINNIKYQLAVDADTGNVYVPEGEGFKQYLYEPTGMLSPTFDFQYEGLSEVTTYDFKIDRNTDKQYDLEFTNIMGATYNFPFVSDDNDVFKFGDSGDKDFIFMESDGTVYNIGKKDYFLLSDANSGSYDEKSVSSVYQFQSVDVDNNKVTFKSMATGQTEEESYDSSTKVGTFNVNGKAYDFKVDTTNDLLMFDQNADGDKNNDFVEITIKGGAVVRLADSSAAVFNATNDPATAIGNGQALNDGSGATVTGIDMRLTELGDNFDSPDTDAFLYWNVTDAASEELDLNLNNYLGPFRNKTQTEEFQDWNVFESEENSDIDQAMTDYGALISVDNTQDTSELTIAYPSVQRTAQVFVVSGDTERSSSAGGVSADKVNPIGVELAVLDVNAPAVGSENMIVVGGPCANTVAAELLGNPDVCGEGFEPGKAMIKSFEDGDKVALLVAGYEADDTVAATRVLANYEANSASLAGLSEAEVVTANLADIQIRAPMMEEPVVDEEAAVADETTTTEE